MRTMLDAVLIAATLVTATSIIFLIACGDDRLMWEDEASDPSTYRASSCQGGRCNDKGGNKSVACCGHPEPEWTGNGDRNAASRTDFLL